MCSIPQPGEKIVPVRCQPKTYPCPSCGRRGHRKRRLNRFVRSLAYVSVVWLHVFYAEYTARCKCRKSFALVRLTSAPKPTTTTSSARPSSTASSMTASTFQLHHRCHETRLLARPLQWLHLRLPQLGDWLALGQSGQRQAAVKHFSGVVCIDELVTSGAYTLLLATDPIADRIIGHRLVTINDQAAHALLCADIAVLGLRAEGGGDGWLQPLPGHSGRDLAQRQAPVVRLPRPPGRRLNQVLAAVRRAAGAVRPTVARAVASVVVVGEPKEEHGSGDAGRRTRRSRRSCSSTAS